MKDDIDNRVCLFYINNRLKILSSIKSDKKLREALKEFEDECIYDLGVNALHIHNNTTN